MSVTVAYSPKYLNWNLGEDHPTNPVRARLAVDLLHQNPMLDIEILNPDQYYDLLEYYKAAATIHDPEYVEKVRAGLSNEWDGWRPDLGETAALMFGGTMVLTERLLANLSGRRVYFNPQGAKHHAMYNHSSGFCVFNDMAWAARRLADAGRRVVYVDWDAHHGDGVESMLRDREDILTISVHDSTIFPGTGWEDGDGFMNFPMKGEAGDLELNDVMTNVRDILVDIEPDVILLACGADGLAGDPLSSLRYTQEGLDHAARMIGSVAGRFNADVLIGGAGGYQPFDEVPEHWSRCVSIVDKWQNI